MRSPGASDEETVRTDKFEANPVIPSPLGGKGLHHPNDPSQRRVNGENAEQFVREFDLSLGVRRNGPCEQGILFPRRGCWMGANFKHLDLLNARIYLEKPGAKA